jgi:hypothetical protein
MTFNQKIIDRSIIFKRLPVPNLAFARRACFSGGSGGRARPL